MEPGAGGTTQIRSLSKLVICIPQTLVDDFDLDHRDLEGKSRGRLSEVGDLLMETGLQAIDQA